MTVRKPERARHLRTRQAELAADLATPPTAPSFADPDLIREHIRAVVTHGLSWTGRQTLPPVQTVRFAH